MQNDPKFLIGEEIYCRDTADSKNLEAWRYYLVTDINEYGNIQVKESTTGKTLEHYYKPNRFELAAATKKAPKVRNIDLSKKYKTCSGLLVNLFCASNSVDYPVVGEFQDKNGKWYNESWGWNGGWGGDGGESEYDLVEVKESETIECEDFSFTVYDDGSAFICGDGVSKILSREEMARIVEAWEVFVDIGRNFN